MLPVAHVQFTTAEGLEQVAREAKQLVLVGKDIGGVSSEAPLRCALASQGEVQRHTLNPEILRSLNPEP